MKFIKLSLLLLATILFSCQYDRQEQEVNQEASNFRVNCPSSHPYVACDQCWENEAQALSAGCTSTGTSEDTSGSQDQTASPNCPASHPYEACGQCFEDAVQAFSAGCTESGGDTGSGSNEGSGNFNPNNTTCVTPVGNGNDGCLNSDGYFVSRDGVVSDPENARLAILDIEINLGIDIDDEFIDKCGYQGTVPSINPSISAADAKIYFKALIGEQKAQWLIEDLDTNQDGILTRNEASQAKGSDPRQVLRTGFGQENGLATDDILAYIGLYLGDGAIDKYAGDLLPEVQDNLATFTRTWQPDVMNSNGRYRN
ncbi:hypothetical protein KMW28_22910 [Flammeovirga yaeyamensis]|uniref:EF-hand domain-containing protein n=1 Tax=Flammeovirga yaeyamensis TaxID=367791 RepID=A0AAX1NCF4_9BACT|nr:hypothetical protein [Flammeovirga yaeyamensis]MBB3696785.1 hypothetical protein [Flammeovirga yaeyamensis]NMF33451.1 hypothetical protein [Flammeovirga yaeyamensis]QWG05274.1 hypothetical protein KMW28_22910 [Flammeovirga yaeyamensis]